MPYQRAAEVVLAKWREVERQLGELPIDSPEAEVLKAEGERLRRDYQALIRAARENDRPEPPPFPEPSTT